MNYLDANFIAALHFNIPGQTGPAERFVRRTSLPLLVSGLAELECRGAFVRRSGHAKSENWQRLQQTLDAGAWLRFPVVWEPAMIKAAELMDKFPLNCGTLDTLHVALAKLAGCTWFLSFDANSNARVLAASARLKIYPDLTAQEKSKVVR